VLRVSSVCALVLLGISIVGCGGSGESGQARDTAAVPKSANRTAGEKYAESADYADGDAAYPETSRHRSTDDSKFEADSPRMDRAEKLGPAEEYTTSDADDLVADGFAEELASPDDGGEWADAPGKREDPRRRVKIRQGTLTAGSFDDHENLGDFVEFVSHAQQHDSSEQLPRFAVGDRVMIYVEDEEGRPIGDARVVVHAVDDQEQFNTESLIDLTTGSDGRTVFLTGLDRGRAEKYHVSVTSADGKQTIEQALSADMAPWRIALPEAGAALPNKLDLALVIDCTGSMSDELEYLKIEIDGIVEAIHEMFPNVDQRFALIAYRDEGDDYVARTFDFADSVSDFRKTLSQQKAAGGGDYPEAMHTAVAQAGKLQWRDRNTARVMFLLADAPPHVEQCSAALAAVQNLRAKSVRIYPVAASGTKLRAEFVLRSAAFATLGQYLFLTDHSGVGNPHAKPHVPSYNVEHLNRLMIRMIASELAGVRLAPEEILAIERGDLDPREADQWAGRRAELNEPQPEQPAVEQPQDETPSQEPANSADPPEAAAVGKSWSISLASLSSKSPWWAAALLLGGVVLVNAMERWNYR
jgi:hypothetical protein